MDRQSTRAAALMSGCLDSRDLLMDLAPREAAYPVYVRTGRLKGSAQVRWRSPSRAKRGRLEPKIARASACLVLPVEHVREATGEFCLRTKVGICPLRVVQCFT